MLEAVLRIVARDAVALAAEAETSLRTTTYYFAFAAKEDLVREAFRFFTEQSIRQIEETSKRYMDRDFGPKDAVSVIFETVATESRKPNTT